jgi:hypothetical protein
MDEEIDEMVAKDIKLPKIVIEGKGKVGENANTFLIAIIDQFFDTIPRENLDLDIWILGNIGPVIEMKGHRKGIGIDQESHSSDQSNGNEMTIKARTVFSLGGRKGRLFLFGRRSFTF